MELTRYNCFVGTARGFLLTTTEKPKELKHVKPEFSSEVTALSFTKEQKDVLIGYKNGNMHRYDPSDNVYLETITNLEGKGGLVGLGCVDDVVIAGKSDGVINMWDNSKSKVKKHFNIQLGDEATLNSMVLNVTRKVIGTGGEKNDFKLWDIETQKCIFKAKSMGHDKLNLPIPTSVRGITFFTEDPQLGCCCTKEGHVLLYDERLQRRPVVKFLEPKASYTTITSAFRERQCLVGTTRGYMQLLDMKAGKCLKTFTTFTGSVTSIACDPVEPYVISTSLDRHLRLHNLETKELIQKVYMKVNLTSLLIRPVVKEEKLEDDNIFSKESNYTNDIDDEYENIFNTMEVVVDKGKKKNKKRDIEEDDSKPELKKSKKKSKVDEESNKIKVKRKSNKVKNIFAQ